MKGTKFIQLFILFLFAAYFSQGVLYAEGSLISQTVLALAILISLYYFIKSWFSGIYKNAFFKVWSLLLILNIFGFIFTGDISNLFHFGMLKNIFLASLPFYPFYYFARKRILEIKYIKIFLIVMLPITILQYYSQETKILAQRISIDNLNVVNNTAYTFVALIPFVFLFKDKKSIANVLMAIFMLFIIQGAKRGALFAGTIGLLLFIYYQLKTLKRKHRIRGFLFVSTGIGIMIYYLNQFLESNEYFLSRLQLIEEGSSSGRNIIFASIYNGWLNGDVLQLLFGFGFASSFKFAGNFAHNDWLELLSNFGLLAVIIYAALFYYGFKTIVSKEWPPSKKITLLCVMMTWLSASLVSMGYNSDDGYLRAIILGYLMGSQANDIE
jgi:hypothetical protein